MSSPPPQKIKQTFSPLQVQKDQDVPPSRYHRLTFSLRDSLSVYRGRSPRSISVSLREFILKLAGLRSVILGLTGLRHGRCSHGPSFNVLHAVRVPHTFLISQLWENAFSAWHNFISFANSFWNRKKSALLCLLSLFKILRNLLITKLFPDMHH